MRILQICSARSIGGGERHVADLSNELARRGHDVFAAVAPDSPMIRELSALKPDRIDTHPLRNAADLRSVIGIARKVRENGIELINAHLAKDYTVAAAVSNAAGVPFILTRHVLFPMSRAHRLLLRRASFVIAPSNAVAANLRKEGIFTEDKIVTIRYGLNVESFSAKTISREAHVIGAIGNLDPVKGFDILIHSARVVANRMPAARFRIVGEDRSGDGHNERDLRSLISELGLEKIVALSGWSADVREELASFDLFVSSSRSESFGFVIAEAMLSGVPVIATETEGAKEIISSPSLGRLVPLGSPDKLAEAILDLLNDPAQRDAAAGAGRRHVAKHFSLQRMADETENLFRRVVS